MGPERWATFDCYGTLVDWDAGIGGELGRLFGDAQPPRLPERYHAIEPRIQAARPVFDEVPAELAEAHPAARGRHVHVAQSHSHYIVPAHELGLPSIRINRLAERGQPGPTRELPDLNGLADVLDELVPTN
jgi:FMN phosphatase YigB (HAD superfamily)